MKDFEIIIKQDQADEFMFKLGKLNIEFPQVLRQWDRTSFIFKTTDFAIQSAIIEIQLELNNNKKGIMKEDIKFTEEEILSLHEAISNIPPPNSYKGQKPLSKHTYSAWQKLGEASQNIFREKFNKKRYYEKRNAKTT